MKFFLKTLTNVSILNGRETYYFISGDVGYKLNLPIVEKEIELFHEVGDIMNLIKGKVSNFSLGKYKINWYGKKGRENIYEVKEIIKYGLPYIPGSSIKGAIATPLLNAILSKDTEICEKLEEVEEDLRDTIKKKEREFIPIEERVERIRSLINSIDRRAFYSLATRGRVGNNLSKLKSQISRLRDQISSLWTYISTYLVNLSVSDFLPLNNVKIEILGLRRIMRRSGPIMPIESISKDSVFFGKVDFYIGNKKEIGLLKKCCNRFYKNKFRLTTDIETNKEILLNVGFGGGFKNKSLFDLLYSFKKAYIPRTKWNADLGWVKLYEDSLHL